MQIAQKEGITLIHLNDQIHRDLFGVFVSKSLGIPCISHLRSMRHEPRLTRCDLLLTNCLNEEVSAYLANSQATRQYWMEQGIDPAKIILVYDAIPKSPVKSLNIRRIWQIDPTVRFIVGCVANLSEAKGHSFLLEAHAEFVRHQPNTVLVLVGDGPLKGRLVRQACSLRIENSVLFVGHDSRAREIIAALDLLVVPSKSEAFGLVLLEAMRARTPIVATNSGGISEIVQHECNGLLVNYGSVNDLCAAMQRVLTDEQLQSLLAENGYQAVQLRFSINRYASEVEQVYERVLEKAVS